MQLRDHYDAYLALLLRGDRAACAQLVRQALEAAVPIQALYTELFRASLYEVGDLWETNRISVACEHLATAVTESVMSQVVAPVLFAHAPVGRYMIVSCVANEHHQIGARMVADLAELQGWDTCFLGAGTCLPDLLRAIDERHPDVLALSTAMSSQLPALRQAIEAVRGAHPHLPIWVGGQMFRWGGHGLAEQYAHVTMFSCVDGLEEALQQFGAGSSS